MKKVLLFFLVAVLNVSWTLAQDGSSGTKAKDEVRTMTGCLTKGDSADEFLLTGTDGSTWEIHRNSSVNLADHVGQQVTVTGTVSNKTMHNLKEDTKEIGADVGIKKDNKEHGHLKVTDVQKLSDSCPK